MHLEEPEAAMILEAEDDPAAVGRIGADVGVDLPSLVVRQEAQVGSMGANGSDVWGRTTGVWAVGIVAEDDVSPVGRPVLLDGDVESERCELEEMTAVDAGGEQRLAEGRAVEADDAERLTVRGGFGVGRAVWRANDALPVTAVEIHGPDGIVATWAELEAVKEEPLTVGHERWRILEAVRGRGQVNEAAAVGVHDRHVRGGGCVEFKDDLRPVRRPVRLDGVTTHVRDLTQVVVFAAQCVDLVAGTRIGREGDQTVVAGDGGVGGSGSR